MKLLNRARRLACATALAALAAAMPNVALSKESQKEEADPIFRAQPQGSLSDATIFVSPGHGWMYNEDSGKWVTQRGTVNNLIEDFSNAEAVLQYLVPYLWNAGAKVHTTRERDMQTNEVIVETGDEGHRRTGDWVRELSDGARGGEQFVARTVKASALKPGRMQPLARSMFTPSIPEDGYYGVYVWYAPAEEGRTTEDAFIQINHTGGTTIWRQNQNIDGRTWKYIGTYYFERGSDPSRGSVSVLNISDKSGRRVVADAVRFGGGMGTIPDENGVSGKPRWEESGYYYAKYMGYEPEMETRRYNTVSAMPMYSEWEAEAEEKGRTAYIGWHTNANNGLSRGLFSFVYSPDSWGEVDKFTGYPGGAALGLAVHNEIVHDVHAAYDPEWRDGGVKTRWLGETNPRNNNEMPAALFEMGFHDNPEDASYILDPQFRRLVARAVYQGIVQYYRENVDGFENARLLPEPPTHLSAEGLPGGRVRLSWQAPPFDRGEGLLGDRATSYRVYQSGNGRGFDNGVPVENAGTVIEDLPLGQTVYFRVAATNEGGESLPTETLAVRIGTSKPKVLLVNGFDRLDRGLNLNVNGTERGILSKMNTFNYSIQHGDAIANAGYDFDAASNDAIASGSVQLSDYQAVVWILGQENGATEAFSQIEQRLLREYLGGAGALFVSGSEAAGGLASAPGGEDFLREVLRAELQSDSSETRSIASGIETGIFEGLGAFTLDDGTGRTYPVQTPDVLNPVAGANAALGYADGKGAAALCYNEEYGLVYLGFPFETINEEETRRELMERALGYLLQ